MHGIPAVNKQNRPCVQQLRDWSWPVALAVCIFVVSGRSQVAAPQIAGIDKVAHGLVFGLLGTLVARVPALVDWKWLGCGWAVILASLYGLADEFRQSFTPGRSVELADWLVDTAGAALAVYIYCNWRMYRTFLESPLGARSRIETGPASASDSLA